MLGIILPLCRIAGLVFGLLAAYYWFKASKAKVTDRDMRYDPRFDFVVNDSGPKISLGRNADQLVSLAGHQVHRENVANSWRVVLVLKRIGLQRRCFL